MDGDRHIVRSIEIERQKRSKMKQFCVLIMLCMVVMPSVVWACSCRNGDVHERFAAADIVVLAKPDATFENDRQQMHVSAHYKGDVPDTGLFLDQQDSSCWHKNLPMRADEEYLLFVKIEKGRYQSLSTCFSDRVDKGMLNVPTKEGYAEIHRDMLGYFLKNKGKIPKVEVYASYNRLADGGSQNWMSIKNVENEDIEVFHPKSRQAYTVFVVDKLGNPVAPKGIAKADPKHQAALVIPAGGVYNYQIQTPDGMGFPFLTGTGQFGYVMEKDAAYKMHVAYRLFGGSYGVTFSKERKVY